MNLLELENLSVQFGEKSVLKNCSFHLKQCEILVVLGASGDGKTTLLKSIAGLIPRTSGNVYFKGNPMKDALQKLIPGHDEIRLINQDFALDKYHSVEENIRLRLLPFDKAYQQKRIEDLLRLTDLAKSRTLVAHSLSGGQQQRLAIARALADEPDLLLLDEPFNQLDFQNKRKVEQHIRSYIRKNKISAVLVTHNGIEAMEWADRILFMRNGKIARIDTPRNFFENPTNRFEASFFGELNKFTHKGKVMYCRPGIFSRQKTKQCPTKLVVEFKSKLDLGWYSEYTFICGTAPVKFFSQTPIEDLTSIFIQPILFD